MLREEGLEQVFARHKRHAEATRLRRARVGPRGAVPRSSASSRPLTAVVVPDDVDADAVRRVILERFDMSLGAGLGKLAGRVFRIGHLGATSNDLMLAGTLCGVEMGLRIAGVPVAGGVDAALQRLPPSHAPPYTSAVTRCLRLEQTYSNLNRCSVMPVLRGT